MPRPFRRRQRGENSRFLAALARTGNARLAARSLGVHRGTYFKRRARDPDFAARWDAALAEAQMRLAREEPGPPEGHGCELQTRGGEPVVVRLKSGRLQLRHALPGRMTQEAWLCFLHDLSETANIRLSAEAAGVAHSSILARRRRSPELAAEIAESIAAGREWVETLIALRHRERMEQIDSFIEPVDWPEGLTLDQALRALGATPYRKPGDKAPTRWWPVPKPAANSGAGAKRRRR